MTKVALDKETVEKIAKLSRINLDPKDTSKFMGELNTVLKYVDVLDEVKTGAAPIPSSSVSAQNLRSDEVKPSLSQTQALSNAPSSEAGYFKVFGKLSEPEE
jgi:aspartyl-tRNA(Asn)/glutamyl-tRNA(Gln) amidotransferase subunit C